MAHREYHDVIIIGGGPAGLSAAVYLSKLAQKVYWVHRRDSLRASK